MDTLKELLLESPDDPIIKNRLGVTLMEEANLLQISDPVRGRLKLGQAISIMLSAFNPEDQQKWLENLCRVYHNYANSCVRTGDLPAARKAYNNAFARSEEIISLTGNPINHDLAAVLIERANLIRGDDPEGAEADYLRAIHILEASKIGSKSHDISTDFVNVYTQYGCHLNLVNRFDEAIVYLDKATDLVNRLIEVEGWRDMLKYKGVLMYYKTSCFYSLNRFTDARQAIDEGILVLQKAVYRYSLQDCDVFLQLSLDLKEEYFSATS